MTNDTLLVNKEELFINKNAKLKYFRGFKGLRIQVQNTLFKG